MFLKIYSLLEMLEVLSQENLVINGLIEIESGAKKEFYINFVEL